MSFAPWGSSVTLEKWVTDQRGEERHIPSVLVAFQHRVIVRTPNLSQRQRVNIEKSGPASLRARKEESWDPALSCFSLHTSHSCLWTWEQSLKNYRTGPCIKTKLSFIYVPLIFSLVALSFLLIIQIRSLSYHSLTTVLLMTPWKIIFWWWVILVKTLQVLFSLFSWCFSSTRSRSPDAFLAHTHSGFKWWFYGLLFLVLPVLVHAPEFLK